MAERKELTGLRFFAAFAVVLFHNYHELGGTYPGIFLENLIASGFCSVSFFFILSGFLLGRIYGPAFAEGKSAGGYFRKRVARIYPVFLLALALDAPRVLRLFPGAPWKAAGSLGANLLLLQAWFPRVAPTWNAPGWSLSNEAFFYALVPWVSAWAWRVRPRGAVFLSWMVLLAGGLVPIYLLGDRTGNPWWHSFLEYWPLLNLPSFLMGLFLGIRRESLPTWLARWGFAAAIICAVLVFELQTGIARPLLSHGLLAPFFALAILSLASGGARFSSWLATRPMAFLGRTSYALYLLHQPLKGVWLSIGPPSFWAYAIFSVLISALVYVFWEEPLRRKLTRDSGIKSFPQPESKEGPEKSRERHIEHALTP